MDSLQNLPRPFFVLAPMDDVTDTAFRQVIAATAAPDLYFTEFVNVDGLQSPGRPALLHKLAFIKKEQPIIAQIWGLKPENYFKTAYQLVEGSLVDEANWRTRRSGLSKGLGSKEKRTSRTQGTVRELRTQMTQQFAKNLGSATGFASGQAKVPRVSGIDINMGCPDKTVVKNGCCIALINNRDLAAEIIQATREGAEAANKAPFPISVKTRLGFNAIDLTWHEFLLKQKLNMLTIHGRTKKELSLVPVHWDGISRIRELRDALSPETLIVGNGDVANRTEGEKLAEEYKLDGIMIGRGVFHDPFAFAKESPWAGFTKQQRVELYKKHVKLFAEAYKNRERNVRTLNKFCKVYISGFDGAKELREQLMQAKSTDELLGLLERI